MVSSTARLVLLCLLAACGEYAHTNPYDPATDVTLVIHGPDSAYSIHENLSFTYDITPNWPGVVPVWRSDSGLVLGQRGPGEFQVNGLGSANVWISVGTHTARHKVVAIQRARRVYFACSWGRTPCPTIVALGSIATFGVLQTDSLGTEIGGQLYAPVQYDVHPSGVLQIGTASTLTLQVTAIGTGRAYLVAALGTWLDSAAVIVQ